MHNATVAHANLCQLVGADDLVFAPFAPFAPFASFASFASFAPFAPFAFDILPFSGTIRL